MNFLLKTIVLFSIIALSTGCKIYNVSNENFAYHYNQGYNFIINDIEIVHTTETESEISIIINKKNLLFMQEAEGKPFTANIKLTYFVVSLNDTHTIIDSLYSNVFISSDSSAQIVHKATMKIKDGTKSILKLIVTDLNRKKTETHLRNIDKIGGNSAQYFDFSPSETSSTNYFSIGEKITFRYYGKDCDNMHLQYFKDIFPPAVPPFQFENLKELSIESDSTFVVEKLGDNEFSFTPMRQGIFFVSTDSTNNSGCSILCFGKDYPSINTAENMIYSSRYICSQKEFVEMTTEPNAKTAIDKFWLKIGTYEDRASQLIKNYYSRVIFANKKFTSYTEGWKTDRGMIYIVLGKPDYVYRDNNSEMWIYGEGKNFYSTTFTFKKLENKFTNNDYHLLRTPTYKEIWYKSVDLWRQ